MEAMEYLVGSLLLAVQFTGQPQALVPASPAGTVEVSGQ